MTRIAFGLGVIMLLAVAGNGFNAVADANVTENTAVAIGDTVSTAQDLAPPECAGMNLTNVVAGSGGLNGTSANDLITGSAGVDTIDGKAGDDCIVAGGGNDDLKGGAGNDVILGGPGDDAIDGGAQTDACYGGGQPGDVIIKCSTVIP